MPMQWTKQQQNAITATDGSVLVSAAAGSGKTAVLVERVIRLITRRDNPLDVDRLLIVTFTRAAAAEMKERIARALNAMLSDDPCNPHLLRQKQLLYNASVSTIDSFCADTVREYFHTLGIARDFRIGEDGELAILSSRALDTVFERLYAESGSDFLRLIDAFSDRNGDARLRATVLKVSDFLATQPFPDKWLCDMLENYGDIPVADTIWGKIIIDNSHAAVSHAINLTENSLKQIKEDEKLEQCFSLRLDEDLSFLNALQKKLFGSSWDDIGGFIKTFAAGRLATPKGYKEHPVKLAVAANREEVKKTVASLCECFKQDESEARLEIAELKVLVKTLFDLVRAYLDELFALKAKKNIKSFSDVESLTVRLLAQPDGNGGFAKTPQAYEIGKRYDAVMVDEFQDVNDVQDVIFRCISANEENLFVVGDVKQSIYGFRQAKPEIFINRRNSCGKFNEAAPEYPATIILDKNFRSRREVCDAVNFIFKRLMNADTCKMDYTSDEVLNAGAEYPDSDECNFEIALIEKNSFEGLDPDELEAFCIADRIHKMIASGFKVKDGSSMRPVTYGDFAVLMRSPGKRAMKYVNTLISCAIPAYSDTRDSFFDAVEIKIMLNFLRAVDNPTLDIPLLSVMCSPIYGFTLDELASIRSDNRGTSLYASVKSFARTNKKAADFISQLSQLREYSHTCSVDELILRVYELTSFRAISLAVSGNTLCVKNLNLLREYAAGYEKNGYKTLSDFISYIDRLIENGASLSASSANDAAGINSVRVLSIHKSKGLEYPVCFLADTARRFNKDDLSDDILIDSKSGLGIRKRSGQLKYGTFPHLAVSIEMEQSSISEELRVLYVALTRAKEKLIAVSLQSNTEKYLSSLYSKIVFDSIIEPYTVKNCRSISDWLCLCALVHPSQNQLRKSVLPSAPPVKAEPTSDWIISVINDGDFLFGASKQADAPSENSNLPSSRDEIDYGGMLRKNLSFKYKNADILSLPQKVTASDIAHGQNNGYFEKILAKPSFLSSGKSSSVERGTAHHIFLQYCDFENARADVDGETERLAASGILTAAQARCIDKAAIKRFVCSGLVSRILASKNIMREERFTAKLAPSLIYDEYKDVRTDALVIIQGAVDLAFEEDGKLVIVDYKTDRVGDIQRLAALYSKQLMLYKEAMRQSTELEVKECILYSVHLNEYINV